MPTQPGLCALTHCATAQAPSAARSLRVLDSRIENRDQLLMSHGAAGQFTLGNRSTCDNANPHPLKRAAG
ncbi:hypothetical protein [Pseudomonas sp. P8_241]|uniref:hypothetical protein n=1 Tax=Pseudomonas sp. P8_241 TaxID=3043445 RepID=UPI002A3620AB|nr:hypothetical protein [Pseudomonas sp. P8_241]WPN44506.1 hypothetical protein QMK58_14970 [Pseudomonas sp. P8_241]